MSAFDRWIQQKHPELLAEFSKPTKARKTQTPYDWLKTNHPDVILEEWPGAARIRARHLLSEVENE